MLSAGPARSIDRSIDAAVERRQLTATTELVVRPPSESLTSNSLSC